MTDLGAPEEILSFLEFINQPSKYIEENKEFQNKKHFQTFYTNWKTGKFNKFYTKNLDFICLKNLEKSKDVTSKIKKKKLTTDRSSYDKIKFLTLLSQQFSKKWLSSELIKYISNELQGKVDPKNPMAGVEILQKIFENIYDKWVDWEFDFMEEIDEVVEFNHKELNSDILHLMKNGGIQFNWDEILPEIEKYI
eukprot:gene12057-5553_t